MGGAGQHDAAKRGVLYVVATPIGNLGDMTTRAREVLGGVDLVAAEDTRRTGNLLARLGITAPRMVSLFEGNERERSADLVGRLRRGTNVALVSDAGMPGVSDPGFRLVRACAEQGIEVRVVPGPSSVLAALAVSGLPTDRFVFEGFLPRKASDRRARLRALAGDARTLVLFESPRRVIATLGEIAEAMGERAVAMCRELTKVHEEVLRGPASEVMDRLAAREHIRGEIVLVVGGAGEPGRVDVDDLLDEAAALVEGGMRKREAAAELARRHGVPANEIYRALVARDRGGLGPTWTRTPRTSASGGRHSGSSTSRV